MSPLQPNLSGSQPITFPSAEAIGTINQLETAEATWKWLQANFLTVEDFEQLVAHGLIADKLAHQLFGDRVEHFFSSKSPIVTAIGIHLIQVEEILQPQLDDNIRQQILMDMFERWLEEKVAIAATQIKVEI